MGSSLLCCVTLCLLGAGAVGSGVLQTPRHLIRTKGQEMTLKCSPKSGHNTVYWYQQVLGKGPQFLVQYYKGEEIDRGNIPNRFSGQQFSDSRSELNINSSQLEDSALYLCASSLGTALQSYQRSLCKPSYPSNKEQSQI